MTQPSLVERLRTTAEDDMRAMVRDLHIMPGLVQASASDFEQWAALTEEAAQAIERLEGERDLILKRLSEGLRERGMRLPSQEPVQDALDALDEWKANADRFGKKSTDLQSKLDEAREGLSAIADRADEIETDNTPIAATAAGIAFQARSLLEKLEASDA